MPQSMGSQRAGHNLVTEPQRLLFLRVPSGGGKGDTVSDDLMAGVMFPF